jgi:YbbR domain-containing protein
MLDFLRGFLRKYVVKNLAIKIVALAVAVFLWWSVGNDPIIEIPITVPLEFHHAPDDLEMTSTSPMQAEITMRGPERLLRTITPAGVHAVINLSGVHPGEQTFDITPKQIHLPRNVEVAQVVPAQIQVSFDHTAVRKVTVEPRVIGALLSGYEITGVTADPATIAIVGPERRLHAIDSALTDPVDASGVVGKATFTTHAYVADPLVRVQNPQPVHVTVTTSKGSKGARQR